MTFRDILNKYFGWCPRFDSAPATSRAPNSLATNYEMGKVLGIEMRKRLEKNLKRYVIAGVIATGCGVLFIMLKLPGYIDSIGVFSSYLIANYGLSKLFKKNTRAQ